MIEALLSFDPKALQIGFLQNFYAVKNLLFADQLRILEESKTVFAGVVLLFPRIDHLTDYLKTERVQLIVREEYGDSNVYFEFANYIEPNTIMLFPNVFRNIFNDVTISELLSFEDSQEILLGHELYHYLEYKYRREIKAILDKNETTKQKRLRKAILEIFAMEYAHLKNQDKISPYILDILLCLDKNPRLAQDKYERALANDRMLKEFSS